MPINIIEVTTAAAFASPARRERIVKLLASGRGRGKIRAELSHQAWIDPRYVIRVVHADGKSIERLLRKAGAPVECHVLSADSALDGRTMPLAIALGHTVGYDTGTLLCCVAGALAYYEGEDDRFVLRKC